MTAAADHPTVELHLLDLRPSVPSRYYTPRARLRRRWHRVLTSPAARHLRASGRGAFWPLAIGSGVVLALVVLAQLQALTPTTAIR
jgi:hypothetical protein